MALILRKREPSGGSGFPSIGGDVTNMSALKSALTYLFQAQAGVLEQASRDQGDKLEQAKVLMSEAVQGFGSALQELDVLAGTQYMLAMELHQVLEVHLEGEQEAKSVEDFTRRILGTLDVFVQAMLEIGQSSFQLVEEMDGIKARSTSMVDSLGELAEVAMRIQMLSLNASIEAAHARQFGAGFAVVAGEVQKLADLSGRISDQISGQVHETEKALQRTAAQVEIIASKDLNEIIQSKQLAEAMVNAISSSEIKAQHLVGRMAEVSQAVTVQVGQAIQALQFEDMVRQILQRVASGSERLAAFAHRIRILAEAVESGSSPMEELLALAAKDFQAFGQESHDSVQASSMSAGDIDLF